MNFAVKMLIQESQYVETFFYLVNFSGCHKITCSTVHTNKCYYKHIIAGPVNKTSLNTYTSVYDCYYISTCTCHADNH